MKPAAFEFLSPETLEEAQTLLAEDPENTKVLAGGQSLVPLLNMRLARPKRLLDLNRVKELSFVSIDAARITIGAMTRQRTLEFYPGLERTCPLLPQALRHVGFPQTRNRGTIGGSLAHGDPAAELPTLAMALDVQVVATRRHAARTIPADQFFVGPLTTALAPDEIIAQIQIPLWTPQTRGVFLEVNRGPGHLASAGIAMRIVLNDHGTCSAARLVLCGVGATPMRIPEAEAMLEGAKAGGFRSREIAEAVSRSVDPASDVHASADLRRHLAVTLTQRALLALSF